MSRTVGRILLALAILGVLAFSPIRGISGVNPNFIVLGYNDLGMHCMNQDFSQFMILPCYNTLHAQVIDKSSVPSRIVTDGIVIRYSVPGNTTSVTKTNFWRFVPSLLGVSLRPDVGLTGNKLSGKMKTTGLGDWSATGIPLTPMTDRRNIDTFQLASIVVTAGGQTLARTKAVVPVSWELRCDLCHHGLPDAPKSVLQAHDLLHGTSLYDPATKGPANGKPVLCGGCHAQPELGLAGQPGRNNLSRAMHLAHSSRMMDCVAMVPDGVVCYACHPGLKTQCLRDIHSQLGMTCYDCHGNGTTDPPTAMLAVADPGRQPWLTEPRCTDCHAREGSEYEQPNTLFRNSKGHGGVFCEGCHNSTHALVPAKNAEDNAQAMRVQGFVWPIYKCTACHKTTPQGLFRHRWIKIEE